MAARVRMADIAKEAGVSYSVVSAVLSKTGAGKIRVGAETAKRVSEIAEKLNFRPNPTAQMLAGKQSRIIGVLIDSYAPSPTIDILCAYERLLAEKGYRILVGQTHECEKNFRNYLEDFVSYRTAAVMVFSHHYPHCNFNFYEQLAKMKNPILFGMPFSDKYAFSYVEIDWKYIYAKVVGRLLSTGCSRIAICGMIPEYLDYFIKIYKEAFALNGLEFHMNMFFALTLEQFSDMKPVAEAQMKKNVDAVITNDRIAAKLIFEFQKLGMKIPDDISIVGCDNCEIASYTNPGLTTIDYNAPAIAKELLELTVAAAENGIYEPKSILVPPLLIERNSIKK